jgi:hypothetical protein
MAALNNEYEKVAQEVTVTPMNPALNLVISGLQPVENAPHTTA